MLKPLRQQRKGRKHEQRMKISQYHPFLFFCEQCFLQLLLAGRADLCGLCSPQEHLTKFSHSGAAAELWHASLLPAKLCQGIAHFWQMFLFKATRSRMDHSPQQSQEPAQELQEPEICQEQMKNLIRSTDKTWIKIRGSDMTMGLDYLQDITRFGYLSFHNQFLQYKRQWQISMKNADMRISLFQCVFPTDAKLHRITVYSLRKTTAIAKGSKNWRHSNGNKNNKILTARCW